MYRVKVSFHGDLNFFLTGRNRKRGGEIYFRGRRSVKDLIESFGVPHVEVDSIFVNGTPVDFRYIIADKDRIEVFPDIPISRRKKTIKLKQETDCSARFLLDVHLKKLAGRMWLLGLDTDYSENRNDCELASISSSQNRLILTRDRQLLMHKIVTSGMYVKSTGTENQIREVLERLDLWECCRPFTRCISCNGKLVEIHDESHIKERVPPGVREWCTKYHACSSCMNIYWEGSHYNRLKKIVGEIMDSRG